MLLDLYERELKIHQSRSVLLRFIAEDNCRDVKFISVKNDHHVIDMVIEKYLGTSSG